MAKVKILTAAEAANLVEDGMTVSTNGFVACDLPEELTSALEKRFLETGSPKNLTYFYAAGQGNRDGSGADHFAHEGMTSTVIAGHYNMAPKLGELIMQNKIKAYNLPQGTLSQLYRDIAAKKLGTLTHERNRIWRPSWDFRWQSRHPERAVPCRPYLTRRMNWQ